MITYQIKDWDSNFENNKSRERLQCSFVCVPNKQHGMSFSRIMAEEDGAMIYGIWQLIIGACSQQKNPRNGWLTQDGYQTGTAWVPSDLALKFRRPVTEIERSLKVLSSEVIGWIIAHEKHSSARLVPAECPSGVVKERKKEGIERIEGFEILKNKSKNSKSSFKETPLGHKWRKSFASRFGHKYEWNSKDDAASSKIFDRDEGWEEVLGWAISAWDCDNEFLRKLSISLHSFYNNLGRFIPSVGEMKTKDQIESAKIVMKDFDPDNQ